MKAPVSQRRTIPFFCHKSEQAYRQDVYERFDSMVVRQSALHLADALWDGYPMQAVLDWAAPYYEGLPLQHIADIGCGVGRWIGTLAQQFPEAACWGLDYSYQMLRRAHEYWVAGQPVSIHAADRGLAPIVVQRAPLHHLRVGLAQASELPFKDQSQDLVVSSFVLDRLERPFRALAEWRRVLRPAGRLVVVTPLNFERAQHWEQCYPPIKIQAHLRQLGFKILSWEEALLVKEPLDKRGNVLVWKCLAFVVHPTNL